MFHKASSPASVRVANLLKKASTNAQTGASKDQASDNGHQRPARDQFELNITEELPTEDQVRTILEYVGKSGASSIINGAQNEHDAIKKYRQSTESLSRPVVIAPPSFIQYPSFEDCSNDCALQTVDWSNGKAIAGDNESEILKLVNASK